MVTINNIRKSASGNADYEFKGLSTDPKPTASEINLGENSLFLELDTGKLYYFNGNTWEEMSMSRGGANLPAVTSEDNGKVLGVVDGQWNIMEIGSDEYETVAEINVGQMEADDNGYSYEEENVMVPTIDTSKTYYLNDADNPSTLVVETDVIELGFNLTDMTNPTPSDPNKPMFGFIFGDGRCLVFSDVDISNTTVKILKKVSSSGSINVDSELSNTSENPVQNKVITAALGNISAPLVVTLRKNQGDTKYNPVGITNAEIIAAYESKRPVYVVIEGDDSMFVVLSASSTTDEIFASLIAPIPFNMVEKIGVLSYSSQGDWELIEGMFHYVPDYTISNAGQVLSVNAQGELEWVTPT